MDRLSQFGRIRKTETARCADRVASKIVFGQACILEEAVQQWFLQRPVGMDRNSNGGMAGLLVTVMTG
jgi:hypothetical protein